LNTGCTEVAQNLRTAAKIAQLRENVKIALRKFAIFWGTNIKVKVSRETMMLK